MAQLVVGTFLSLDGVMQGPGGPEEDRDGGFDFGGWSVGYWNEEMGKEMDSQFDKATGLLLGRRTYEIFAAHWPHVIHPDDVVATKMNSLPKYVASRTLRDLAWDNSHLIEGEISEEVGRLKKELDGEIQVHGSHGLLQTLLAHDLIDELRLWMFPVVVGSGKRLFGEGAIPGGYELVNTRTFDSGVGAHTFRRAGEIKFGSFALGDA